MSVPPLVRRLIVCDRVAINPADRGRLDLYGVTDKLSPPADATFPLHWPSLTVLVELSACRGPVRGLIRLYTAETGIVVAESPEHTLRLPNDPLATRRFSFKIDKVPFPSPGLYWVQFWCNGRFLEETALTLRPA